MKISLNKIVKGQEGFTRKKIIITTLILLLALVIFFILTTRKEDTIKIAAILALSGSGQNSGEGARDGILLAVDEVNTWGGIDGKKIELIIEDSKTDPEESKEMFDKIESIHHPVLYLSTQSNIALALGPLAQEHQVVLFCMLATASKITENREWVFRYWPTAEAEVPPILSILEKLKVKKLGVLYHDDEFGRSLLELTQKEFKKTGGNIETEGFVADLADLKESIAKLSDMEGIYIIGYWSSIKKIIMQLKEANYKGIILTVSGAASPEIITLPEAQGVYVPAPIIYNPNFPFAKEVEKKYINRYNKPFNHFAAVGYSSIKILAGLWEDEDISRERVKTLLEEGFIYSGVFRTINVKPGEHDISFPLYPAQIINGKVKYR